MTLRPWMMRNARHRGANDAVPARVNASRRLSQTLPNRFQVTVVLAVVWLGAGCTLEVEGDPIVDTVRLTDTIVRVDTVMIRDSTTGLGSNQAIRDTVPAAVIPPPPPVRRDGSVTDILRQNRLMVPVAGVIPSQLRDTYFEKRGSRVHEALDIGAARGTPVLSVDDGRVAKLFTSDGGGLTVYAEDPSGRLIYYYAHLDAYRPGLKEGEPLTKGEVIGIVGTTGNAPPNVPHLHFAVGEMGPERRWYRTTPIDARTYLVLPGVARAP
jgi:murein DD-endopeptidase MepM/ murein hydrolase activator NlpD